MADTLTLTPTELQDALDVQAFCWSAMAAFALICYDTAIAMDQEIQHIWRAKWSFGKVLYLLSRYVTIFGVLLWWLSTLPGLSNSLPRLVDNVRDVRYLLFLLLAASCEVPARADALRRALLITGVSVDLIQLLRIRAVYSARRYVTIPLYLLFAGEPSDSEHPSFAPLTSTYRTGRCLPRTPPFLQRYSTPVPRANPAQAAILVVVVNQQASATSTFPNTAFSIGCLENPDGSGTLVAWIGEMCLGAIFFALTLAKLHPYLRPGGGQASALTAMVQGGVLYYAVIFAVELVNVLFLQLVSRSARPELAGITQPWTLAVYGIAGPRLVLHLKGVMSPPSEGDKPTVGAGRDESGSGSGSGNGSGSGSGGSDFLRSRGDVSAA
ncbi:hypothetical protein CALCODRAFT_521235 [Calocera cornea HHB12733]|uniref:DUF6533 domain-containing protein n=1 Tax=Calocera cornea HHB12733 TaxID=1353952 RepID=A0A165CY42_9BASI|nr:hypothetical protein CALCODRAFT_521235 [Calocera cornea HHB12733]